MKKSILTIATVAASLASSQGAAIHAGLLNYWDFNGNANDTSGSFAEATGATVDNGSVNGTTTFATGLFGDAASLPGGAGNNITFADSAASSAGGVADDIDRTASDMTLSVWFNADSWTTGWQAIVSHGENNDYRLARRASNNPLRFAGVAGTGDIQPATTYGDVAAAPAINTWHHILITSVNGGASNLYVDGMLEGTNAGPSAIAQSGANNNVLCVGCNPDNGREFDGLIDDIGLWDRALTAAEVTQIHTAGLAGTSLGAIPEPTAGLLGLLGFGLMFRRRR